MAIEVAKPVSRNRLYVRTVHVCEAVCMRILRVSSDTEIPTAKHHPPEHNVQRKINAIYHSIC